MLSTDIAQLYGVEARVLVQALKRNIQRFPYDFMFELRLLLRQVGGMHRAMSPQLQTAFPPEGSTV